MAEPLRSNLDSQTPTGSPRPANQAVNYRTQINGRPTSANDNESDYAANDNQRNEEPQPAAEEPLKLSNPNRVVTTYNKPPDTNRVAAATRAAGTAAVVGGAGVQVTGKGMQVAGRGMQTAGKGMLRAGTALSGTGLGAIVGVPLAAVGAGAQVAGTGAETAGKVTNAAGKGVRRAGSATRRAAGNSMVSRVSKVMGAKTKDDSKVTPARLSLRRKIESDPTGRLQQRYLNKATNLIPNPAARAAAKFAIKNVNRVKTAAVTVEVFAWATPLWLTFQLPLAVLSLVLFGIMNVFGSNFKFGFDTEALFTGLYFVVFLIGFVTLIIMAFQYIWTGTHCFFGKGALLKFGSFVFAVFFYMMPFLNLFPWFMVWALFVNRYPE